MKDFLIAALPWILMGLAVAIIAANYGHKTDKEGESKVSERVSKGMAIGMCFGVAIGCSGVIFNLATGIALGSLWGMAIAMLTDKDDK